MTSKKYLAPSEVAAIIGIAGLISVGATQLIASQLGKPGRSLCLANMKQIGASLAMYSEDYNGVLPRTTEEKPSLGLGAHWTYLIQPYVRSETIFLCPSDKNPSYTYQDDGSHRKRVPLLSYINNYALIPAHDFFPVPIAALQDPSTLIAVGERRGRLTNGKPFNGWKGASGFQPGQPCKDLSLGLDYHRVTVHEAETALSTATNDKQLLLIRLNWGAHGDGSNYVFADGHARFEPLATTLDPHHFQWGDHFYPRSMPESKCDPSE